MKTVRATNKDKKPVVSKAVQTDSVLDISSYKVNEYFHYNAWSYYDLEDDMTASRNPQPSSRQ